jgi:hypothetical protein
MLNQVEGIENDDKILIIVGKNGGAPDVKIAHNIQNGLSKLGFDNIHIRTDDTVSEPEKNTSSLIVVGGPGINQMTKELIDDLKLQFYELPLLPTTDPDKILTPSWGIVNTETKENYGNHDSENFGLGFIHNLYRDEINQHIFVIAGIEAEGTNAASEYFFGQKCFDDVGDVEFVIVNSEDGRDEKGCAKTIGFELWTLTDKIFEPALSLEKNILEVTKILENDGFEKITFNSNDPFKIKITLKNNSQNTLNFSFDETLPKFFELSNEYSSECRQIPSKIHCEGILEPDETIIINYEGIISKDPDLGNWVLDKTKVKSHPTNIDSEYDFVQSTDIIIRVQDMINVEYEISLDEDEIRYGDTVDAIITLKNTGVQSFVVNGTLSLTNALEFVDTDDKSSIDFDIGDVTSGETKELIFKLRSNADKSSIIEEEHVVEFSPNIVTKIYNSDGTWNLVSDSFPPKTAEILVMAQNDNFYIILLSTIISIAIFITVLIFKHYKKKILKKSNSEDDDEVILKDIKPYDPSKEN